MERLEFDEHLVRSLIRDQHPDLAGLALREVDGGWDNQLWRLGDELAVRMPCTERAPSLQRKEQRWMPALAALLPLPVPVPVRVGEPSACFPRPWTITAWVPGEPADRAPVTRGPQAADDLAGFLRALHRPAPDGVPAYPRRGPGQLLTAKFDELVQSVEGIEGIGGEIRDVWDQAAAAPAWEGPPTWLHGDLHPANVVVADGTLAGVLDFGELAAGDPAADLAAAWLLLPAGADTPFLDAYANADEAMIRRARGRALLSSMSLMKIGRAGDLGLPGGKPTWGPAGRSALDRVLASI